MSAHFWIVGSRNYETKCEIKSKYIHTNHVTRSFVSIICFSAVTYKTDKQIIKYLLIDIRSRRISTIELIYYTVSTVTVVIFR